MIVIASKLENREAAYVNLKSSLESYGFGLGGNWEYDHGYFDRSLDKANRVWLRVPFRVTHGTFDGDSPESDAVIRLGEPFVLKHVYQRGLDAEASPKVTGSLVDQFQEPVDSDARVEPRWVEQAGNLLRQVEAGLSH